MTAKELRKWLFERTAEDSWYVSLNGRVDAQLFTLDQVQAKQRLQPSVEIRLLHVSMIDMSNPPWVDFDTQVMPSRKARLRPKPAANKGTKPPIPLVRKHHPRPYKPVTAAQGVGKKRFPVELLPVISLGLALIVVLMWWGIAAGGSSSGNGHNATSRDAYYQTKNFIMPYLAREGAVSILSDNSPQVSHTQLEDGRFRVISFARVLKPDNTREMISYNATLRHDGEGKDTGNWTLEHLRIGSTDVVGSTAENQ